MAEIIRFDKLSKYYASTNVQASNEVSFSIEQGEVHAICGENGAGKTTLMRMLFGMETPDSGSLLLDGKPVSFASPSDAISAGIGMVHQHFMIVPSFSVAENIMLGNEQVSHGFLDKQEERNYVRDLSERYGLPIDPDAIASSLPVGLLQRVEILKMLAKKVRILILDEPTAVLTPGEVGPFLHTLTGLAHDGYTILFISHKLQEVLTVADRITVMRKGQVIGTKPSRGTTMEELAMMMVGRPVVLNIQKGPAHPGSVVLKTHDLTYRNSLGVTKLDHVSLSIRAGEVYGVAGVSGNGQEALVNCLSGLNKPTEGSMELEGQDLTNASVRTRRDHGMAQVPEDRIHVGLNMDASVEENLLMGFEHREPFSLHGILQQREMQENAGRMIKAYAIFGASAESPVRMLSGGNMQKVVLARELSSKPRLLIVDQPTRGLDVGSIEFVHRMILSQRDQGVAVLLVSVELEEILSLSDRVGVMYAGRLQGELEGKQITQEAIGMLMVGGSV
jgi:simple sugar transport system ATP-binding protein